MIGKVKWFSAEKGYGFLEREDGGDVFVHFSAIQSELKYKVLIQDADVDFELDKTQKGLYAKNVRVVTDNGFSDSPFLLQNSFG